MKPPASKPDIQDLTARAQAQLGAAYFEGRGVKQNYAEAYFWFLLAAAEGLEGAREQADSAAMKLNSAERVYAEKLADRWSPAALEPEKPEILAKTMRQNVIRVAVTVAIIVFVLPYGTYFLMWVLLLYLNYSAYTGEFPGIKRLREEIFDLGAKKRKRLPKDTI